MQRLIIQDTIDGLYLCDGATNKMVAEIKTPSGRIEAKELQRKFNNHEPTVEQLREIRGWLLRYMVGGHSEEYYKSTSNILIDKITKLLGD
jgi:hypothetical protein